MSQFINASVENGTLKPERDLGLASGTKVRITTLPCEDAVAQALHANDELDELCDELPIDSQGDQFSARPTSERR
jgi:predicted DNA-binding antitoxin AbrB/MazE fold protein